MRYLMMLLMGIVLAMPGQAKIYKWKMPDGSVRYADKPQKGGEEVKLPELQFYTAPPLPAVQPKTANKTPATTQYKTFKVSSPKADQVLRDNSGKVSVQLSIDPGLDKNHSIEILMDGKSIGSGRGTSVSLTNVDRGSHTLQASIKDKSGKAVKQSASVTFHLKRHSIQ